MAEVRKVPYAPRFTDEEIDQALTSAVAIFSEFEQKFVPGMFAVLLRTKNFQRPADFAHELIPGLLSAHRFFGDALPTALKKKLVNQTQTHDTLFELTCLGAFQPFH